MRMIPRSPIEISLEAIGETTPGWDRTLRHSRDSVFPLRTLLQKSVPVQGGTVGRVRDVVVGGYLNSIAPIGLDCRLDARICQTQIERREENDKDLLQEIDR